ncbi:winged helix-turn-helix domain-containing protein [Streptomyces anandii]|uniref:winged helix-turn-helix domain-containing protein n=1 Tax=Streptomyces anandii TaxID=285454 RepID=UPI0036A463EE
MAVKSYKEIVEALEQGIKAGEFNKKFPTQRTLCIIYGSSNRTVAKAMGVLMSKGLIYSKPGKGYYIKKDGS